MVTAIATRTAVKTRRVSINHADEKITLEATAPAALTAAKRTEPVFPDIQTIRDAIPAHCFEASTARSLAYLARDFAMCLSLGWLALTYIPRLPDTWPSLSSSSLVPVPVPVPSPRLVAWCIYGYVQGLISTGIWILGHEAGHGAFSPHGRLNDLVGWAAHSFLLVPYFSWKFSHHRHHRFTGHMSKDMVFVPATVETRRSGRRRIADLYMDPEIFEDAPVVNLAKLVLHQLFGWQAYLLMNVTAGSDSLQADGRRVDEVSRLRVSHFEPTSKVFRSTESLYIALSDLGLAIMGAALWYGASAVGWKTMFALYFVPYFWVHHWLVAITYLHHTHPEVPHYDAEGWTYVKGALATIDRDFGFVGKHLFHGIIETHTVHHLFPRIPFYKQDEATEAVRAVLGDLYRRDTRSFLGQLWSCFTTCQYVEDDPNVPGAKRWASKKQI